MKITCAFWLLTNLVFIDHAFAVEKTCSKNEWNHSFNYSVFESQFPLVINLANNLTDFFNNTETQKEHSLFRMPALNKTRQEEFFDTPKFRLYRQGAALYLHKNTFLTKYNTQKLRVFFQQSANEPLMVFSAQQYKKKSNEIERHPLFGILKKKQRPELKKILKNQSITHISELKPILNVDHTIQSYPVYLYYTQLAEIQLDHATTDVYGFEKNNLIFRYQVFPANIANHLTPFQQQHAEQLLSDLRCYFTQEISAFKPIRELDYHYYYEQVEKEFPWYSFFSRFPMVFKLGQIVLLCAFGFLIICLLLLRLEKRENRQKPGFIFWRQQIK